MLDNPNGCRETAELCEWLNPGYNGERTTPWCEANKGKNSYERISDLTMNLEGTLPADSPERSSALAQDSLPVPTLGVERSRPTESAIWPPDSQLLQITSFTRDLFGASPDFEIVVDPSEPEDSFVVATIDWKGDARELIQRRLAWHDRARAKLPELADRLRLSVMPS